MTAANESNTAEGDNNAVALSPATMPTSNYAVFIRRFLEDAGALSADEAPISLSELKAFLRGRMVR